MHFFDYLSKEFDVKHLKNSTSLLFNQLFHSAFQIGTA
jgi:hypothetical protein